MRACVDSYLYACLIEFGFACQLLPAVDIGVVTLREGGFQLRQLLLKGKQARVLSVGRGRGRGRGLSREGGAEEEGWKDRRMGGWKVEGLTERIEEWKDERIEEDVRWRDGKRMDGRMKGWMDGRREGCKDGKM